MECPKRDITTKRLPAERRGVIAYSHDNFTNQMVDIGNRNRGIAQKNVLDIILMDTLSGSINTNRTAKDYYFIDEVVPKRELRFRITFENVVRVSFETASNINGGSQRKNLLFSYPANYAILFTKGVTIQYVNSYCGKAGRNC